MKAKLFTLKNGIVQNGPRQQIMKMFNKYRNTNGDERIT